MLASPAAISFTAGLGLLGSLPRNAGIEAAGLVVECPAVCRAQGRTNGGGRITETIRTLSSHCGAKRGMSRTSCSTLWDERSDDVSLRLVRPIGPGSALRGVPIDLSADLPRRRTDYEQMRFEVLDEALDETTVSYEDEEESAAGGSA